MARFIFLFAVLIPALLTPWILYPAREPCSITRNEIFAALAFYPCFTVSIIGLVVGLAIAFLSRKWRLTGLVGALLALVLPGTMIARWVSWETNYDAEDAWFEQVEGAGLVNFLLYRYVREHPDAVTYPSNDSEEVEVSGFLDVLRSAEPIYMSDSEGRKRRMRITPEGVFTPWGARVHFAVDRNHDGFLTAGGQRGSTRYGTSDPWTYDPSYSYSFATGVFLMLPDQKLPKVGSSFVAVDNNDYDRLAQLVFSLMRPKRPSQQ